MLAEHQVDMSCRVSFHLKNRSTACRGRAQTLNSCGRGRGIQLPLVFSNSFGTFLSFAADLVSRYTTSTLAAEPGRPRLPTCALRDNELFVPAETRGAFGHCSSRSCLVDSSSICSPQPGRVLCPWPRRKETSRRHRDQAHRKIFLHEYCCQSSQRMRRSATEEIKDFLWSKTQHHQQKTTKHKHPNKKRPKNSTRPTRPGNLIDLSEVFSPCI